MAHVRKKWSTASLTVEAALVLPLFLFAMIALLYFIQIFLLQEHIQAAITKMGLSMAKTAYLYDDFKENTTALDFDETIFEERADLGLTDFVTSLIDASILKQYAKKYLNTEGINQSFIINGLEGVSFHAVELGHDNEWIDIQVHYRIRLPLRLFVIRDMTMLQRIRVRAWTGLTVAATYRKEEGEDQTDLVYVSETGTVYHRTDSCSHIRLSIRAVHGIPRDLRNDQGAKYYPCESCAKGVLDELGSYYITSDGNRYHTRRDCSRIKRNVRTIAVSEVGSRSPCKRCWK